MLLGHAVNANSNDNTTKSVRKSSIIWSLHSLLSFDQIIKDEENVLYKILKALKGEIDFLVNTSFNVAGDPIVEDWVDCYVNMRRLGTKYIITSYGLYQIREEEN